MRLETRELIANMLESTETWVRVKGVLLSTIRANKRAVLLFLALAYLAAAGLRLMQLTCREGAGRILS
jgi:uncharacterized membrane protein YqjE